MGWVGEDAVGRGDELDEVGAEFGAGDEERRDGGEREERRGGAGGTGGDGAKGDLMEDFGTWVWLEDWVEGKPEGRLTFGVVEDGKKDGFDHVIR